LIYKISSTCFGQSFAHLQERMTEIFTAYGILQRIYPSLQNTICCKNLRLTLLKMGKRLPETCWA